MNTLRLGILGGGQLGRMLALAAAKLGVRTRVFDPAPDACAAQVAEHIRAEYGNKDALSAFCDGLDAATLEFENVPIEAAEFVANRVPLRPTIEAVRASQDRLVERQLLKRVGFQTPKYEAIASEADFSLAISGVGVPSILKTRRLGYDGKGQVRIKSPEQIPEGWSELGGLPAILDELVSFEREISLVMVRGCDGECRHWDPAENIHRNGILHSSRAQAEMGGEELSVMRAGIEKLAEDLGYVGVLAVEFFQAGKTLLANEYAPRVHNSGHWTIEGAVTSQFENHVRAVLGLGLGSVERRGFSAMVNLIGSTAAAERLLAVPGAQVHVYGKDPRPGRKVGHVTVCCANEGDLTDSFRRVERTIEDGAAHGR